MRTPDSWIVVGLDCGGTSNNATVLNASGRFLVDQLVEVPSLVQEGPEVAVGALARAFDQILELTGTTRASVRALGLDTPGPASADGVISSKGATNFSQPAWRGFDFRGALEAKVGLPVVYNNDANAAALYAHHMHFGAKAAQHSSISAIVGTGLGGGVIEAGRIVRGAAGMAGELGHVHIPMHGLLDEGQPLPQCNCGFFGDAESVASLSGIAKNLLPYWLTRFDGHPLAGVEPLERGAGEAEDGPLVPRRRAVRAVEVDRGRVPVQHAPFQPAVAALDADAGQLGQQGFAETLAAALRPYVEVLEVDAVAAQPGREAQEPQRETGHLALDHGDVGEHRGLVTEQGALQQLGSQLDLVGGPLVGRQITHELHHRRHVLHRGAADYRHLPSSPPLPDDIAPDSGAAPSSTTCTGTWRPAPITEWSFPTAPSASATAQ